jgi:hypothetical protein
VSVSNIKNTNINANKGKKRKWYLHSLLNVHFLLSLALALSHTLSLARALSPCAQVTKSEDGAAKPKKGGCGCA